METIRMLKLIEMSSKNTKFDFVKCKSKILTVVK